jgi:hypothetical protein
MENCRRGAILTRTDSSRSVRRKLTIVCEAIFFLVDNLVGMERIKYRDMHKDEMIIPGNQSFHSDSTGESRLKQKSTEFVI